MKSYLKSCAPYFAFAGLFSLFINTLHLTFSLYMLAVYSRVLGSGSMSTLYVITLIALTALFVFGFLEMCRSRLLVRAGIKLDQLLTGTVLRAMLRDLGRLDGLSYNQGIKDINVLRNYLGGTAIFAFFDVPWIFIYLGIIYLVHPLLGLTATFGAVGSLTIGLLQTRVSKDDMKEASEFQTQASQWLTISFRTARELLSMGMIPNATRHFIRLSEKQLTCQNRASRKGHFLTAMAQSFSVFMQVAIFGVGALLVIANKANPGVIIAASIIMGRALAPVTQGITAWKQTAGAREAFENLSKILATDKGKRTPVSENFVPALSVDHLVLDIEETRVLDDVNFTLAPGEILGVVGPNGAGKTCLFRTLLGMWPPSKGSVSLDNIPTMDIDDTDMAKVVGYLPQNVELFAGSVSENIARMGEPHAQEVVGAAKKAGAHETILQFPNGYETDIGEAGQSLSGGQRQRVGLARAVFGDPRLVLLDEPNSNLDQAGDAALGNTLKYLKDVGATTIIITHKPELLHVADKILVLNKGRQTMFGPRAEVFEQMMGGS